MHTRASYSSWLVVSAADCILWQGCQVANIETFAHTNSKNCAWFLDGIWNGGFPVCESEMEGESSAWGLTCCVRFIFLKSSHVRPDTASLSLDSWITSCSAWTFADLHWGWFLMTDCVLTDCIRPHGEFSLQWCKLMMSKKEEQVSFSFSLGTWSAAKTSGFSEMYLTANSIVLAVVSWPANIIARTWQWVCSSNLASVVPGRFLCRMCSM